MANLNQHRPSGNCLLECAEILKFSSTSGVFLKEYVGFFVNSCDCVLLLRACLDATVPFGCLIQMTVSLPFQDTGTTVSTGKTATKRNCRPVLRFCQTGSWKLKYCFLGCGGNFVFLLGRRLLAFYRAQD